MKNSAFWMSMILDRHTVLMIMQYLSPKGEIYE